MECETNRQAIINIQCNIAKRVIVHCQIILKNKSFQCVIHQHSRSQQSYTTRNWGDSSCNPNTALQIDIPSQNIFHSNNQIRKLQIPFRSFTHRVPISMIVVPGFNQSPLIIPGFPTAETTKSADRHNSGVFGVCSWAIVHVMPNCWRRKKHGMPTRLLQPITRACRSTVGMR